MPHWGGIIPDDQLQALVAYLKTPSKRGIPGLVNGFYGA
jgi:hypothetical protein